MVLFKTVISIYNQLFTVHCVKSSITYHIILVCLFVGTRGATVASSGVGILIILNRDHQAGWLLIPVYFVQKDIWRYEPR